MDSQTQTGAPAHKQSHLSQHCHAVQFSLSDPKREGSRKEELVEKYFLTEFAALLKQVFGGVVVASSQEPGVVEGSGDQKASEDPSKYGISQT